MSNIIQSRIIKNKNNIISRTIQYVTNWIDYKNHDKELQIITIMSVSSVVLYVVNYFIESVR